MSAADVEGCIPAVTCRRTGRKRIHRFSSGVEVTGYTVIAEQSRPTIEGLPDHIDVWVAGVATECIDHWGRKQGWIVMDPHTGDVLLGAGTSTKIGKGLSDCIFMFADHLNAAPYSAREPRA